MSKGKGRANCRISNIEPQNVEGEGESELQNIEGEEKAKSLLRRGRCNTINSGQEKPRGQDENRHEP
jgi:hypothetical protein